MLLLLVCVLIASSWTPSVAAEPVRLPPGDLVEFPFASEHQANALALGAEGSMWFSLEGPGQLDRMTPQGVLNAEVVLPKGGITDLIRGPGGYMWFLNDYGGSEYRPLIGYATPSGQTYEFPIASAYLTPGHLITGQDGTLWYTTEGKIWRFTFPEEVTEFPVPQGETTDTLTVGPEGNIWFTDLLESYTSQYYIGFITPQGQVELWPLSAAKFGRPTSIAAGADGNLWFTEYPSGIGRVSPSGAFTEIATPMLSGYSDSLVLGPDGDMWFTEAGNALGRVTPAGEVRSFGPVLSEGETPARLVADTSGHLWYSQAGTPPGNVSHIGRITVPLEPSNQEPPRLSGVAAVVGQTLGATSGGWLHEPSTFEYQWQACDANGGSCADIVGQTAPTHVLTTTEVGGTLRVLVTARNVAGAVSVASAVSSLVVDPASSSLPQAAAVPIPRPPELPSSAKLDFERHPRFVIIEVVRVLDAPLRGWIDFLCHGRGCPLPRRRITVAALCRKHHCSSRVRGGATTVGLVTLKWPFGRKRLSVGSAVAVDIGAPGWIGKSFGLVVRAHHIPALPSSCLQPNSDLTTNEC